MLNKVKNAATINYTNAGSSTIPGGSIVKVGDVIAITVTAIPPSGKGACNVGGVYSAQLTSAVASSAGQGAAVYAPSLPSDGRNLTITSGASTVKVGQLEEPVTSGGQMLIVRI